MHKYTPVVARYEFLFIFWLDKKWKSWIKYHFRKRAMVMFGKVDVELSPDFFVSSFWRWVRECQTFCTCKHIDWLSNFLNSISWHNDRWKLNSVASPYLPPLAPSLHFLLRLKPAAIKLKKPTWLSSLTSIYAFPKCSLVLNRQLQHI